MPLTFSHIFHSLAVKYEIVISVSNGPTVRIYRLLSCGSGTEVKLFQQKPLSSLSSIEKVVADKDYRQNECIKPDDFHVENNLVLAHVWARHWTFKRRLKPLNILRCDFRKREHIWPRFQAVTRLVTLMISKEENRFYCAVHCPSLVSILVKLLI